MQSLLLGGRRTVMGVGKSASTAFPASAAALLTTTTAAATTTMAAAGRRRPQRAALSSSSPLVVGGAAAAAAAAAAPASAAAAATRPTTTSTVAPTITRRPRSLLQRLLGAGRRTGDAVRSLAVRAAAAGAGAGAAAGSAGGAAKKKAASTTTVLSSSSSDEPSSAPWLIVGLGNPGPRYDHTRHNVGFAVVDALAAAEGIDMKKLDRSSGAVLGSGNLGAGGRHRVLIAKPMTFMNVSGEAVGRIVRQRGIPPSRVLVVSDDLDSPLGRVRLRAKGGHGGHNGLRSIVQHLGGTHDFPRLKVGIGRPAPEGPISVADYVLQRFSPAERAEVDSAVAECLRAIDALLEHGVERAMSGVR